MGYGKQHSHRSVKLHFLFVIRLQHNLIGVSRENVDTYMKKYFLFFLHLICYTRDIIQSAWTVNFHEKTQQGESLWMFYILISCRLASRMDSKLLRKQLNIKWNWLMKFGLQWGMFPLHPWMSLIRWWNPVASSGFLWLWECIIQKA